MKYLFIILSLLLACAHIKPSHPLLTEKPVTDKTVKPIVVSKENYSKYTVKGRCGDLDGPKEQTTKLNVTNSNVTAYDLWLDTEFKNLTERVVFNYESKEIRMQFSQVGCSHFGWTYTFYVDENFPYQDVNKSIAAAVKMIEFGHKQKIYNLYPDDLKPLEDFKKNIIISKYIYSPKLGDRTVKTPICEKSNFQIHCGMYRDPVNYEVYIRPTDDKKYTVTFNYWYVM